MKSTAGRWAAALVIAFVALGDGRLVAQNGSQFRDWKPAALAGGGDAKPSLACGALTALTGYELSVSTPVPAAASAAAPGFCRVTGLIPPEVRFELELPTAWNGRLYMFGNGG